MSLLFDQNLSQRLPTLLAAEFPGSTHVAFEGLIGADDRAVWAYAATRSLAVVSKDADFLPLASTLGPPPKFVWLRAGNGPTHDVQLLLQARVSAVRRFLADPVASVLELP